jgi:DNA repair protein RecO (recombination protein O)
MTTFEGLIVKQVPFQESSKILHLYTAEGMRSVLVHGAKKLKSPFLSASENLNLVQVTASDRELATVTEADLVDGYPGIKADLEKLAYAQHVAELLNVLAENQYDHAKFYAFVKKVLSRIDAEADYDVYVYMLELKYLYLLGVAPSFGVCAACGRTDGLAFHVRTGGASCPEHAEGPAATPEAYSWMARLYRFDIGERLAERPSRETSAEIRRILDDYYAFHLGFRSKSRSLLSGLLGF